MRRTRGTTILEMVVLLAVTALLTITLVRAFAAATVQERNMDAAIESEEIARRFEDDLRGLIRRAVLSTDVDDPASYFLADSVLLGGSGVNAASLTFTAHRAPSDSVTSSEMTFEELNERIGPPSGIEEISLSTTPFLDSGGQTGLFVRRQTPADGDPTQGGYEELLSDDVESIRFEFFDGSQWVGAWDTEAQAEPRLPAAVRIIYVLISDPDEERTLLVRVPYSDVTPRNPAISGGIQ